MTPEPLPEDLRRFILTSVPSVPFVEALLIFREAARPLPLELLARRLYVSEQQALEVLQALRAARIVEPSAEGDGHRYAPAPDIAPMLDALEGVYRSRLVEVTALIHSRTGRMAQQFADAFRIRKD